jgi:hypothetical protein
MDPDDKHKKAIGSLGIALDAGGIFIQKILDFFTVIIIIKL